MSKFKVGDEVFPLYKNTRRGVILEIDIHPLIVSYLVKYESIGCKYWEAEFEIMRWKELDDD